MDQKFENQEFGLRDLFRLLREYRAEILRGKWIFVALFTLVGGYFLGRWIFIKPQYVATTSFMLNDAESSNLGFSAILGQIGLPSGGQRLNLHKILEIAKTRRIGESVYFTKVNIQGKDDWMGNHLIEALHSEGKWFSNPFWRPKDSMQAFRFPGEASENKSLSEKLALKELHSNLIRKMATFFNEKTGIMEISIRLADEELAIAYSRLLYEQLSEFYIDKAIEKQQDTYQKLQSKVDSLRNIIFKKDYSLAEIKDSYRNLYLNQDAVPQQQIDRDIRMLSIIYGEALKNLELASFNLQNKTPFIQYLDLPTAPLDVKREKLGINLILALVISAIAGIMWIVLGKIIRDNR
jgi:hypothetical protein